MPRESSNVKAARLKRILDRLRAAYPEARCELSFRDPLELLIATILSAQTTDKQVNVVTARLFEKYRTAADYAHVALSELEEDLKSIGLFRNKARNIQNCCKKLLDRFGGNVPRTMGELIELDGVGRKTANVVLGNAFGMSEGIVVDTHVARIANRLGLVSESNPQKIEAALQKIVPQGDWIMFSHLLIWHGRRRCYARKPDCPNCEVNPLCPSAGKFS